MTIRHLNFNYFAKRIGLRQKNQFPRITRITSFGKRLEHTRYRMRGGMSEYKYFRGILPHLWTIEARTIMMMEVDSSRIFNHLRANENNLK